MKQATSSLLIGSFEDYNVCIIRHFELCFVRNILHNISTTFSQPLFHVGSQSCKLHKQNKLVLYQIKSGFADTDLYQTIQ